MDNAQKAIMIGVGLFVTIIIISVVLLITNLGTGLADDAAENVRGISEGLQQQIALSYDDKEVTDKEVIACAQMYGTTEGIVINVGSTEVTTGAGAQTAAGTSTSFIGNVVINDNATATITFTAN